MKYKAVIFDLFGTLVASFGGLQYTDTRSSTQVSNINNPLYSDILIRAASVLSVPADDFLKIWSTTAYEGNMGVFPGIEANIVHICRELGVPPDNAGQAARIRRDFTKHFIINPRPDAEEVISRLKNMGYKTGLVSNCNPDTPMTWTESPIAPLIDVAIFSSSVGLMKPDARIYRMAAERLVVNSDDCLYIADGVSNELVGAAETSMHPVQIFVPDDASHDPNREKWNGHVISSLTEVLSLVE